MLAAYENEGTPEAGQAGGERLMRRLGLLLLCAGLIIFSANLLWETQLRPGGPGLTVIGLLMLYCARIGRVSWAVHLMCWGLLLVGWSGALVGTGLYNISWIALPIATMMGGCMLGRRMTLALLLATVAAVLSVYGLHRQGHEFGSNAPPQVVAGLLILTALVAGLIGRTTVRAFRRQMHRLGESQAELERAQSLAHVGSWTMEVDSGQARWSDEYYRIFGIAAGSPVSYASFMARVHPEDKCLIDAGWVAAARGDRSYEVSYRILVGAEVKWLRSITEFVFDAQGQLQTLSGSLQDITEIKRSEEVQRESQERFRKLFEDTHQPIVLYDSDSRCVAANQASLAMFRFDSIEQIRGRKPTELSPPWQADGRMTSDKLAELQEAVSRHGSFETEWLHCRCDGESFPTRVLTTGIRMGEQDLLHSIITDTTEQKRALEQIEFLAYHDPLTGLPNRTLGQDRLQQALNAAEHDGYSLGVLYLDLDNFKHFNDVYGHAMGDRLLKSVATRLVSSLRAEDTLCRLSGDEFMVVLLDLHASEQLQLVCQRILARIAEPIEVEGLKPLLSFSIGGAIYPQHGRDIGSLMRHADLALYEAKKAGRGRFRIFEPQMNESLRHYLQTCDDLRLALDREEFELHYQPQIALHNSEVIGVEALLRWNHPQRGLLQPGTFIGVAEESGLIAPIGRWVLQEACRQGAAWHRAGWSQLRMAVNLSAVQFRHGQLGPELLETLAESGFDPKRLELELTESTLLHSDSAILATVAQWQAKGIELSIDDFGTGYSSLSYLKRLNVDKLKIDRSFIANLREDEQDRTIVRAIIQIAQSMGIKTIAEGIEDPLVVEQLRAMGCDKVQGFWYSKPLPAGQFEQWFKHYTVRAA